MRKEFINFFIVFLFMSFFIQIDLFSASVRIGPGATVTLSGANLNVCTANGATGFTLEFAVRPATNSGYIIFFQKSGAYTCNMWNNSFRLSINSPSGSYSFPDSNIEMTPNMWHPICIQIQGNTARLFAGGATCDTVVRTGDALPNSASANIVFGGNWVGDIDEIRISKIARYSSGYILSTGPFVTDANTVGLWHFDEGSGTTSADSSGNGYTAQLSAGVTWQSDYFSNPNLRPYTGKFQSQVSHRLLVLGFIYGIQEVFQIQDGQENPMMMA